MAVILSPRGNEASNMMKRFVRYEEAAQYFGIDETLIVAYAKAAGAVYQLSKIRLIKIEPLEDYMKHLTKVGRSSKLIQRKFVRVGEGTLIYNIGRNRFIEMARAAGAVYKIGDSKGSKVLIRLLTVNTFYPLCWKQSPWHLRLSCAMPLSVQGFRPLQAAMRTGQRPLFTCVK